MGTRFVGCAAFALFACGGGDEAPSGNGGDGNPNIDPCDIVTQADATALFEQPAEPDTGPLVTDPAFIGACYWRYDTPDDLGSQSLAFYLWNGPEYYAPATNADPFDIGDEGAVEASAGAGVDVLWRQGELAPIVSYFNVGTGVPDHLTKMEDVKALALEASDRLP